VFVGAIPAGLNYTITLEAGGSGQSVSCTGSATFNVTAEQTSTATVSLSCQLNQDTGGVVVDANTNLCPVLEDLVVAPPTAAVGSSINLGALANDLDSAPQAVSYTWTSTLGTVTSGTAASASLACTTVGDGTVTLTYTDGACSQSMTIPMHCVEGDTEVDAGTEPEPDAGPVGPIGQIRITEWMYDGAGGEWVELTNVGSAAVDLTGWSFDDDSALVGVFPLTGFGVVAPGESVVFTESTVDSFRTAWGLCSSAKLLGGYTNNLGRADQINIFDAAGVLVDRLNYGDQAILGSIRTTGASGWVSAAGLGANNALAWMLSTVGDAEGSWASSGNAVGSPGFSTRATVAFSPCTPEPWSFQAWPGSADVTTVDATATFTGDVSGLTYEPATASTPNYLWVVENGNGLLYRLELSGGQWLPSAGEWANGKNLRYTNGAGVPDSEGVTKAELTSSGIYVATERDNNNSGVSRPAVLRFDTNAAGTALTATHEWNLTSLLPVVGANLGLEAVTFVPDSFLVANGFLDESTHALYAPATYGDHGAGLFFVGLEGNGRVYAFALNHTTGAATLVANISSSFGGIMGMEFDRDTGSLWATIDNTGNGRSTLLQLDTQVGSATRGSFVITAGYDRPANLPNANNEGFAVAPESECIGGVKAAFWGDDDDTAGFSIRQGTVSCGL
jgi:hypothetical protein